MARRHFVAAFLALLSGGDVMAECVADAARYHSVPARLLRAILITDAAPRTKTNPGYDTLFEQAASIYAPLTNQDPAVFAEALRRIAHSESGFRQEVIDGRVTSRTGATGLMQFQPRVAKALQLNPRDPKQSIYGAAYLLTERLQRTDGNMLQSIAAYNGAFAHIRDGKWQPETQEYVDKIFGTGASIALMNGMRLDLDDSCAQSYVGAWVLSRNIAKYGPTWNAVAARDHHGSGNARDKKKKAYIKRVWKAYVSLPNDHSLSVPVEQVTGSAKFSGARQIRIGN